MLDYLLPVCITIIAVAGVFVLYRLRAAARYILAVVFVCVILLLFTTGTVEDKGREIAYALLAMILGSVFRDGVSGNKNDKAG